MEVRPGYKQTEVGVIPEDWEVKPLGEIGSVRMCKRVLKHQTREHGDVPFFKIGTFGGVSDAFIPQSLFDEFRRKYPFPKKGDILISAAGTIGRTVIYDGAPAYFQDSNIVWIDNDESKVTNAYLGHRYQVTKWSVSHGGTVARLYNDSLRTKIHIPVPTLLEQRAIAAALSDVDALLGGLDRLIAKKRDLKQAAMQQLLTGQTRLPGFHGEWEVKRLGDVGTFCAGTYLALADYRDGEYEVQGAGSVMGRHHVPNFPSAVSVIGRVGTVGRPRFMPMGCWVNNNAAAIVARGPYGTPEFVHLLLQTVDWSKATSVTAQPFLVVPALMGMERLVPESDEQRAIAAVLSDMDAELAAIEARRDKTRDLKQAMMQELLTGKTRLVPAGAAHA